MIKNLCSALIGFTFVLSLSAQAVESSYWLVNSLWEIKTSEITEAKSVLKGIPKGTVIIVPVVWTASLCDYNKSIVTYKNHLGNIDATCLYIGSIRNSS